MALFKCKMCGGSLEIHAGETVTTCQYCDTQQTVPAADDEKKLIQFERAERLRKQCEFDKAAGIYETIVADFREEAEAYWGLVLCKYGIEYVDDPATGKKIPTCHRSSFDSVMDDANFEQTLENADSLARKVYREEAKVIEEIRKGIVEVSSKEEPYDIFICYKETDQKGERTIDSVLAQDVYDALTAKGYRVFFARISLEDKLGREYEPYIFAALNSAKVMLAFGTDYEYYNAVWVKNEWARFLELMAKDKSRHLIPCYKGIDAYDIPKEFAALQGQDLGKVGATQDLLRGIEKLLPKKQSGKEAVVVQQAQSSATEPLLKRAFMFLEDGDWKSADEYCEKVLDIDPENASAYLGKLMAELKVRKQEALKDQAEPFDHSSNYQKTIRFAGDALRSALSGYVEDIKSRNEAARLNGIYNEGKNAMAAANTEKAYKEAARLFESIGDYLDSASLAQGCYEKAEIARKDAILVKGNSKMTGELISNYESAIKLFESIPGWKDADEKVTSCKKKMEELKEAYRLERARIKKRERIIIAVVCALLAFPILFFNIIPYIKYNNAITLMNDGKYEEAISAFASLDGYKDSEDKILECKYEKALALIDDGDIVEAYEILISLGNYKGANKASSIFEEYKIAKLKSAETGDYVFFGAYEQDDNTSNGKEEIEWLVLEVKDGKALVISKYALDCKPYNTDETDVTWENCSLRAWLNNDFLDAAFSADEKKRISTVTVSADKNPEYDTNPGKATKDRVFLLSIAEANQYFDSDAARQCEATRYTISGGTYSRHCRLWLRSPGHNQSSAASVLSNGGISENGYSVYDLSGAVRPALWIDLNS